MHSYIQKQFVVFNALPITAVLEESIGLPALLISREGSDGGVV